MDAYEGLSRSWLTPDSAGRETLPVTVCLVCFTVIPDTRQDEHDEWHGRIRRLAIKTLTDRP